MGIIAFVVGVIVATASLPYSQGAACSSEADVMFLLDSSASEGLTNFRKQVNFVKDFVRHVDIGPNDFQVGLITFASSPAKQFWFNDHMTKYTVLSALDHVQYSAGATYTHTALAYVTKNAFTAAHGGRPSAAKVVVIMTDGQSTSPTQTRLEATKLKQTGAVVIAVGVGSGVSRSELNSMATDPSHVFTVSNFNALSTIQHDLQTEACNACKTADLVLVLDSSYSEGKTNYQKQVDFVKGVVQQFPVGPDNFQVAVVTFASNAYVQFYLNQHTTTQDLAYALTNVPYRPGATYTDEALALVRKSVLTSAHGARANVPKIVVVLTDGQSSSHTKTLQEAKLLKDAGVVVIAVGIGSGVKNTELVSMATDAKHVLTVKTFDALNSIARELTTQTCQNAGTTKVPTSPRVSLTTPAASPGVPGHLSCKTADLGLILDSSYSEGKTNFQKQVDFVKGVVQQFPVGPDNFQVAVVTFATQAKTQFHLDRYASSAAVTSALSRVPYVPGATYTHEALALMRKDVMTSAHGARANVPKIVIVLTDGQSSSHTKTLQEAKLLRDAGVVVIAVGIGSGVRMTELDAIATDARHVFTVKTFDALHSISQELTSQTCKSAEKSTTLTVPLTTAVPLIECGTVPTDLLFVVDSSASLGPANFKSELQFVGNISSHFDIAPDKVQVGLVTFATSIKDEFSLGNFTSRGQVLGAINNTKYIGGNTNTAEALKHVRESALQASSGARAGAKPIVIVVTDGQSTNRSATIAQAGVLRASGVEVVAVGVGAGTDSYELRAIASDPSHVFQISDFRLLSTIVQEVTDRACAENVTQPTQSPKCETAPADLVFVLDSSSSESRTDFEKMKAFVQQFVKQFQVGPANVQVALVAYSTSAHVEFYLDDYKTQGAVLNGVEGVGYTGGTTYTNKALELVRREVLTAQFGARPGASKTVIVLTDGQSSDGPATLQQADLLKNTGVKLISVGVGGGVDHGELEKMATDTQHAFTVANFDALNTIKQELTVSTCQTCGFTQTADVVFLLDGSSSEGSANFRKQLNFVNGLVSQLPVGPRHMQFALATFASTPQPVFWLNSHATQRGVQFAVQQAAYPSGTTQTDLALQFALNESLTPAHGMRNSSAHYVILLTDGKSTDPNATLARAQELRAQGVHVLSIGIGDSVNKQELTDVAGGPDNVFFVTDFDALKNISAQILQKTCTETVVTATTMPTRSTASTTEAITTTTTLSTTSTTTPSTTTVHSTTPTTTPVPTTTPATLPSTSATTMTLPTTPSTVSTTSEEVTCKPNLCLLPCPLDEQDKPVFKKDANGCDICECA